MRSNKLSREDIPGDEIDNDQSDEKVPLLSDNVTETTKEKITRVYGALKPFVIISSSYLLYTITDGAVRMIVLLHAFSLNFTALETAIMFSLYELAGVFTNLVAGVAGARWGIKSTLITGLCLQFVGIGMLFGWQENWTKSIGIVYVTVAQMFCGISKDLVKLGGKTVTKLVTPEDKQTRLFKIVSLLTGWKNTLKGVGYFLGSALLMINYYLSLGVMCVLIVCALPWAICGLSKDLGRTRRENIKLSTIFKKNFNVNILSLARFFLFGSRDLWFEVPLPFFLRSDDGIGWERAAVGAYLAGWIIIYGQVQSWSPQLLLKPLRQSPANKWVCALWGFILIVCPVFLGCFLQFSHAIQEHVVEIMTAAITVGLIMFAVVFAVNSAVHSYLIVKYSEGDKVAMNVGFYYMANAMGRLTGTLLSGVLYDYVGAATSTAQGFASCFWVSVGFAVVAACVALFLNDNSGGLQCGPCLNCLNSRSGTGEGRYEVIDNKDDNEPTQSSAVTHTA
ncbi:major facilitator superfamily-like [Saccoglossus kowalevskii]|uniref:Major facilitator superfamily-like n=1 Tax=Saccoglossus kowalevskii TaxID=10224 RepID=A0A0U2M106_SACKO|nr:major facilitator superfamily-like [Saccoglossus kowalevskii]ALR88600.1 major facilitator transporter algal-like [Saccoglossus kowalevskii]